MFAALNVRLYIRLSVRPSVARWHCVKTTQATITKSDSNFGDKEFVHPEIRKRLPRVLNESGVGKIRNFQPISVCPVTQENRAVARKPRDAAAVFFGLKFADNIHYKFRSSQASKARLHSSKHTGTKQNLRQNGDSRSRVFESVERR